MSKWWFPLSLALSLSAQEFRGRIGGTVLDPQGAPMPDARVLVVNSGTKVAQETRTNERGT